MSEYKVGQYDIKEVQAKMLEILIEIDRICRKHGIKYILDGGSMLGAVRHKGFIPWDDDLDIAMLREDYNKLIAVCKTELDDCFYFQTYRSERNYPLNFGKMKLKNTLYVEAAYQNIDMNHGIYVDIFPIDNIKLKSKKFQCRCVSFINSIRITKIGIYPKTWKRFVYLPFTILPVGVINDLAEWVMNWYNKKHTPFVYKVCHQGTMKPIYPRELYENIIDIEFEGHPFYVPADYEEFLKGRFGNYMQYPPKEQQQPCHNIIKIKL